MNMLRLARHTKPQISELINRILRTEAPLLTGGLRFGGLCPFSLLVSGFEYHSYTGLSLYRPGQHLTVTYAHRQTPRVGSLYATCRFMLVLVSFPSVTIQSNVSHHPLQLRLTVYRYFQ